MATQRPYVPAEGVRITWRKRVYMLRETDGRRLLFNVQALTESKSPSYRVVGEQRNPDYYHLIVSIRTGKPMGHMTSFMAQVRGGRPFRYFPLWRAD